jgi:hypothetical protein
MSCSDVFLLAVSQTMNLIINLDHDDWILSDPSKTLVEVGAGKCLHHPIRRNTVKSGKADSTHLQSMKPNTRSSTGKRMKLSSNTQR